MTKEKDKFMMTDDELNAAIRMSSQTGFGPLSAEFLSKSLSELKPKTPLCVSESSTLAEVISLLQKYSVGSVLILNSESKVSGIFTERDCLLKVIGKIKDLSTTSIGEVMTRNPETQKLDGTIAYALNLMSLGGFRHIPIVDDDGMPVGIISVKQVVDHLVGSLNQDLLDLTGEE
jgi:CBS domain-containing protein